MTGLPASGLDLLFLTQTYPRFEEDTSGPFIRDLARALVRGGDRVTALVPHAEELVTGTREGVEVVAFRYAPAAWEVLGYGRTLAADERVRGKAALVAPLYALAARSACMGATSSSPKSAGPGRSPASPSAAPTSSPAARRSSSPASAPWAFQPSGRG